VKIPYEPTNTVTDEEEEYDWYFSSQEEKKNIFLGKTAQTKLSPPGFAETVDVFFQRYHRFSDGDDSLAFLKNREDYILKGDLKIDHKDIKWNKDGVIIEHTLSDTASVRKKWVKQILFNKSLYVLESTYDSILGPSDFIKTATKTFEPKDTVFSIYHFHNMDSAYLDALCSPDSTVQVNARQMSGEMDFSTAVAPRIRHLLRNLPPTEDDEQKSIIKENLTYGLKWDTSQVNIQFIKEEYYKNMDSAYYQIDLLRTLQNINTKESIIAFKQLILDEPPIVMQYESRGAFSLLSDSLLLSKLLMPEMMNLISLNEYESMVFSLAATLMDSVLIAPKMIEADIPLILIEAKNELKRINAASDDDYGVDCYMLLNYCSLLHPFREKPEVKTFFNKAYSSKKTSVLHELVKFDLEHNVAVSDTLINRILTKENRVLTKENRVLPLYELLYKHKMTNRLPAKYNSRDRLINIYIKEKYRNHYDKAIVVDSVDVFYHKVESIRGDKLDVYYCKYKRSDSKQWKGLILMFDAKNPDNLWPRFVESSKTIVLDEHEIDMDEMDLEYIQLVERNRYRRNFVSGEYEPEFDWY